MAKRSLILGLALLMLALCACGGAQEAAVPTAEAEPTPAPAPTEAPVEETAAPEEEGQQPVLPDAGLHEAPEAPQEDPEIAERRARALEFVGEDAEKLIEALGEPLERNYAPSCLGSGEDGELVYEGFTVYTYREGDRETVKDVA